MSEIAEERKNLAAINPGEPDERPEDRRSEVEREPSTASTRGEVRKTALWKSVLSATGGFGCERETFYREVVRDPETGYRLDFGMDEPVIFGIAVDRGHRSLMEQRWKGEALNETTATEAAVSVARGRRTKTRWADAEWTTLADRVHLALEKLTGSWANRVNDKGERQPEPEGTPAGPPLEWLDADGLEIIAQQKFGAPDVVGGRGISGQPDYVYRDENGIFLGWADIKALSKAGSYPAKWSGGEAVTYDYLLTTANRGVVPTFHTYLEYRRVAKPYWAIVSAEVAMTAPALARAYFARWERALDFNDPDVLSFSPRSCAKCQFRAPIPQLDFAGCAIGAAVVEIIPLAEDES